MLASSKVEERICLDLFAGWPKNKSKETDEEILGSVHRALNAQPPFTRIGLFEVGGRAQRLEVRYAGVYPDRRGIPVFAGDCNEQIDIALAAFEQGCLGTDVRVHRVMSMPARHGRLNQQC